MWLLKKILFIKGYSHWILKRHVGIEEEGREGGRDGRTDGLDSVIFVVTVLNYLW